MDMEKTRDSRNFIGKAVPSATDNVDMMWGMARPHMPPWMKFEGMRPKLLDEFKLHIELSGEGHFESTPRVISTTAYCVLFANLLIFCKATFVPEDETSPQMPSHASTLGFIFLRNLGPQSMNQKLSSEKRRTSSGMASFSLSVSPRDTITFILPIESISISQSWQEALKKSSTSKPGPWTEDDPTFIQVLASHSHFLISRRHSI
jgi:hypothetical protein